MEKIVTGITKTIGIGMLVILPVYLTLLLLIKVLSSVKTLLSPIIAMLPDGLQNESLAALLMLTLLALIIGSIVRTDVGKLLSEAIERNVYQRIRGYSTLRTLTRRLAGQTDGVSWLPAFVNTDDGALTPAFVVEELPDGRYVVFVPSVPTPLAGGVFVYPRERVYLVDVPFSQAIGVVSHWGEGTSELVSAMK